MLFQVLAILSICFKWFLKVKYSTHHLALSSSCAGGILSEQMGRRKCKNKQMGASSSSSNVSKRNPAPPVFPNASGYHGLKNQGATCYLNSVLQVLFMTRDFREAVRSSFDNEWIDPCLNRLFETLQKKTAQTQDITNHLGIKRVHEQHDAAECFEKILRNTSSNASRIFQGELTRRSTCFSCNSNTTVNEPFWSLPLSLLDSDSKDYCLINEVTRFFQESRISGENQIYCEQCKAKADCTIKAEIRHHPEVLTVLLKRFKFDFNSMEYVKLKHKVEIPYELDIQAGGQSQAYQLYAFVEHVGDLRHGHYTVIIKSPDDEKWYHFNDTVVTLIKQQPFQGDRKTSPIRSQRVYLLFYRKVPSVDTFTKNITAVSTSEDTSKREEAFASRDHDSKTGADNNSGTSVDHQRRKRKKQSLACSTSEDLDDERLGDGGKSRSKLLQCELKQSGPEMKHMFNDKQSTSVTNEKQNLVVIGANSGVDENHRRKENQSKEDIRDKLVHNQGSEPLANVDQHKHLQAEIRHEDQNTCKHNISGTCEQNEPPLKTSEREEAEEAEGQGAGENRVFTVRENLDGETCVEKQEDEEKRMTDQDKVIDVYEGGQKEIGDCEQRPSFNNQEAKSVVNISSDRTHEHDGDSEVAQDNGPPGDISLKRQLETARETTNERVKEVDGEGECELEPGDVDTLTAACHEFSQKGSPEPHGDENMTGKVENSSGTQSLSASDGNKKPQSEEAARSDKKRKKGQNKTKNVLFYVAGLK